MKDIQCILSAIIGVRYHKEKAGRLSFIRTRKIWGQRQ